MEETNYTTKEAVLKRGQEAIGVPFRDMDASGRLSTGKGAIGTVIEEGWFGYKPNSESEPDFPEAGVELKVTPYVISKGELRAKERLVCNIINYMEEYQRTFQTSSFWHKCNTMLIMSYQHIDGVPKGDLSVDKAVLFSFPEEDLVIIEQDWEKIMAKVRRGEAHLISEGDTLYLAACTKGANAQSVRPQPFSTIPAKQRAYSLKSSYMTQILNKYIFGNAESERIIKDWRVLRTRSFEDIIVERLMPYFGMTQEQLIAEFGLQKGPKDLNALLLARMLGLKGKLTKAEEFQKAGIVPKTVRVQRNGRIKESMSFPAIDFIRLSQEDTWEESELYGLLAPTKFMFVIFQEQQDGKYVFSRVKFWNIPNDDLDEVEQVWRRTVETIRNGVKFSVTSRGAANNLPKQSESRVAHVRPHGHNGQDMRPLPDGRRMTRQCFWLNNTYIAEQIKE